MSRRLRKRPPEVEAALHLHRAGDKKYLVHKSIKDADGDYMAAWTYDHRPYCMECGWNSTYPCPTFRALGGTVDPSVKFGEEPWRWGWAPDPPARPAFTPRPERFVDPELVRGGAS